MEDKVSSFFGLGQLKHFPQKKLDLVKENPIEYEYKKVDKTSLVGIEVEVEGITSFVPVSLFWKGVEDSSLKVNGIEFVSLPICGSQIEYAVRDLFSKLKQTNDYFFSPRCSIHVHTNVRNMSLRQVQAFVSVYLLFERGLFHFIGHDRDTNIHCVPLLDSSITSNYLYTCLNGGNLQQWMKYTALNLLPIACKGTVEFRHLHGTDDISKLMTWISFIIQMKNFVYKSDIGLLEQEIVHLNSSSQYTQFLHKVFSKDGHILDNQTTLVGMEEGCTKVKQCFYGTSFLKSLGSPIQKSEMYKRLYGEEKSAKENPATFLSSVYLEDDEEPEEDEEEISEGGDF